MLYSIEPVAIEWGIPAVEFWELTFNEIMMQIGANKKVHEREMREKAVFDYNQAQLLKFAFNDPSKMPKFEEAYSFANPEKPKEVKELTQAEIDLINFEKWAAAIKQNQKKKWGEC